MADEYISKQVFNDAIREAVRRYPNTFYNGLETARQIAHDMDAADVAPIRHGFDTNESRYFHCSECDYGVADVYEDGPIFVFEKQKEWRFCPNCGALMDGKSPVEEADDG